MIWLLSLFESDAHARQRRLPPLEKPVVQQTSQQQQQLHQQPRKVEYCLRMAFKLTPTYSSKLQARVRWMKVIHAAQQPQGGGWDLNFNNTYMTPRRLQKLADVIDAAFFDGSFAEVCGPSFIVQDTQLIPEEAGNSDTRACGKATAGYEPAANVVIFYRPRWRTTPSLQRPIQADGVYCTNKLAWLAHTLGHEMVHCIIHHACPEARERQAYVADHGHGPVFLQLNKHIFGHDSTRYRAGWSRLRPTLQVEPLQVTHLRVGSVESTSCDMIE